MVEKLYKISDYVMIKEAAALLGTTPNTLRNWEKRGIITVYRNPLNSYRCYKIEDLRKILDSIVVV